MTRKSMPIPKQVIGFAGWLVLAYIAATIGGLASLSARSFYAELTRPAWSPPGWLFGPVWTVLYTMMGVAAWLVWRAGGFAAARTALILFLAQLVANALWSWVFFAWRLGALAFVEILVLWALIAATIVAFRRTSRFAAVLLLPYLAWVGFAATLTWAIWRANPQLLA